MDLEHSVAYLNLIPQRLSETGWEIHENPHAGEFIPVYPRTLCPQGEIPAARSRCVLRFQAAAGSPHFGPRAGALLVRKHGDRALVEGHLAQRGIRYLLLCSRSKPREFRVRFEVLTAVKISVLFS
jgi:hypothetical protein